MAQHPQQRHFRFGDFVREVSIHQTYISYNDLSPKIKTDASGKDIPYHPPKVQLRPMDTYRLLKPYVSVRFLDQLKAVVPLAIYLFIFQMLILQQAVQGSWSITLGLIAVIFGLMFFMEGLKLGLMPFGEAIGNTLPKKSRMWVVLSVAFCLGVLVTYAEPAIGALQEAGKLIQGERAPYLYVLLNHMTTPLVLSVGAGVGLAAIVGTLRFIYGWSLKPLATFSVVLTLALTIAILFIPELTPILGLAWDCGAVTTGPVTVPLVLSLGIGVASAAGKGENSLSGFGIVTLASLFPIIAVLCLGLFTYSTVPFEEIQRLAATAAQTAKPPESLVWLQSLPDEVTLGLRAIIPLVIFLFFVMRVVLREKIQAAWIINYGICLAVLGMIIFNFGLKYGLSALGQQSGSLVPGAFQQLESITGTPIYSVYAVGLGLALAFAWFLGFGATLAEPALNALGDTVENLTQGAFKKSLLMYSVSLGVGMGLTLGVLKIIYEIQIAYLIIPGYLLGLLLTWFSSEEFVNVAWDSAGVTTGPVTVPLVLAMGLGFGGAVNALEGFGILSMASICPILSVLCCGLFIQYKEKRKRIAEEEAQQAEAGELPAPVIS